MVVSKKEKIIIFDTTLRDGEQSPGASLSITEKLEIAQQLATLGVDVIEAGFPVSSPTQFQATAQVAEQVIGPVIAGLARANQKDIEAAGKALAPAEKKRIHTFIATSPIHMKYKLRKSSDEVLKMAVEAVKYAKSFVNTKESTQKIINRTLFGILQAARVRISKTEYIACPSCGRTLFDLQETTEMIRKRTEHLKGLKIAVMGCIVNGPGEMADADYGYVGSGVDKITLYKEKEIVKRNVPASGAVDELIELIKADGNWLERKKI